VGRLQADDPTGRQRVKASPAPFNTASAPSKLSRGAEALGLALRHPGAALRELKQAALNIYREGHYRTSRLPIKDLFELIEEGTEVRLCNFDSRAGNVSCQELLAIGGVIAFRRPKVLLEIGTFDGNTTLQMALNAPAGSVVHTIDLPPEESRTKQPISPSDVPFISDAGKARRKYLRSSVEAKVVQHLGDSTDFGFEAFTGQGAIDLAFIDGGHSYECVRSDTENVMRHLAPNGVVMWHDFSPLWTGVYRYLNELSAARRLVHIRGTTLAYWSPEGG
jgi:predicted O-methyltransferase YrrM